MSRNLARTDCYFCSSVPVLSGMPKRLDQFFPGMEGDRYGHGFLIVQEAECPLCCARYLAWVDDSGVGRSSLPFGHGFSPFRVGGENGYFDLSFRSTFNDEPGPTDCPLYEVEPQRVGPWKWKNDYDEEGKAKYEAYRAVRMARRSP